MRSGRSDIQTISGMASGFAIAKTDYFKFPGVTADSRVVASISEVDSNGKPFIGAATLRIDRVAPNDNDQLVCDLINPEDERASSILDILNC